MGADPVKEGGSSDGQASHRKVTSAALPQESSAACISPLHGRGSGKSPRRGAAPKGERRVQLSARALSSEGFLGLLPRPPLQTPRVAGRGRDPVGSGRALAAPPLISKGLPPQCPAVACSPEPRPPPKTPRAWPPPAGTHQGSGAIALPPPLPDTSCPQQLTTAARAGHTPRSDPNAPEPAVCRGNVQ